MGIKTKPTRQQRRLDKIQKRDNLIKQATTIKENIMTGKGFNIDHAMDKKASFHTRRQLTKGVDKVYKKQIDAALKVGKDKARIGDVGNVSQANADKHDIAKGHVKTKHQRGAAHAQFLKDAALIAMLNNDE